MEKKKNKTVITKRKFSALIKLASQPIKQASGKSGMKKADNYNDKQTRQHKAVDTSGKRSDMSR